MKINRTGISQSEKRTDGVNAELRAVRRTDYCKWTSRATADTRANKYWVGFAREAEMSIWHHATDSSAAETSKIYISSGVDRLGIPAKVIRIPG